MFYVYSTCEWNDNLIKKALNNKKFIIPMDKKEYAHFISKEYKINIEGQEINCSYTLEYYIKLFNDGSCVELIPEFIVLKEEVIELFAEVLYQKCNNGGATYADNIYSAECPDDKINEYINDFLLLLINYKMENINFKIEQIKENIKNKCFEWD